MKSSSEIRESFLTFFEKHGHRRVASHSIIPPADPTLLFVNAGMVQFKDVFVGNKKVDYKRASSSQKCLRVSGKHNDLENVGRTARHHTFFEMLGNFSFGDYFKQEAIRLCYDYLVKVVGLDPDRLYYTVFGGDEADGLGADTEAEGFWMETAGVARQKILRFGKKDNFWAMGEAGPCGPCSEVLYDRGPGPWACGEPECAPGCDCDRYMEVWNLVFMQYERKEPGGPLMPLPAPSIDTGMGLERLTAIVQEKPTNYDTDLFMPLIVNAVELLREATGRELEYPSGGEDDVGLRVIADHARAAAFLVYDGVYPDNEGRGYITRLLVRRAVRFGRKLGFEQPFFSVVCDRVVDMMNGAYPELAQRREVIAQVIGREEEIFNQTYDEGVRALEQEIKRLEGSATREIGAAFLFLLHDERGLQPDLVDIIAAEHGFSIDRDGYAQLMEKKKMASGKAAGAGTVGADELYRELVEQGGPTRFTGYEEETGNAAVVAIIADGRRIESLPTGHEGIIVLDVSPFYAESGGQVGDKGVLAWEQGSASVHNTTKTPGNLLLHHVRVANGELALGTPVRTEVDGTCKAGIRAHHSATHLLHQALAEVLGSHIKQEGSLVKDQLLRFDFRHFSPLKPQELEAIEASVAARVLDNSPVETNSVPLEEAVASGAKAFFDEKYDEEVRLVTMGGGASRELCGGNHVRRTGEIGLLRITRQEAVSSGVRRIYAVCHMACVDYLADRERRLQRVVGELKTTPEDLEARVSKLLSRNAELESHVKQLEQKLLAGAAAGDAADRPVEEVVAGLKLGHVKLSDGEDSSVRSMSDMLRDRIGDGVVLVGAEKGGKLMFVIAKTKGVSAAVHCGHAVREVAAVVKARGGGKPDFGQAGGGRPELWNDGLDRLRRFIEEAVQS